MVRDGLLSDLRKVEYPVCEPCLSGKRVKKPFPKGTRSSEILTIIQSDICGPLNVQNRTEEEYFITFVDDYSRFGHVYLTRHNHEALKIFQVYTAEVKIKLVRK